MSLIVDVPCPHCGGSGTCPDGSRDCSYRLVMSDSPGTCGRCRGLGDVPVEVNG